MTLTGISAYFLLPETKQLHNKDIKGDPFTWRRRRLLLLLLLLLLLSRFSRVPL